MTATADELGVDAGPGSAAGSSTVAGPDAAAAFLLVDEGPGPASRPAARPPWGEGGWLG